MDLNKPITNPMLVGAIELLKAEDTPEHRKLFVDEVMKATFLIPTVVTPVPEPGKDGKVKFQPDSKIQFPMLTAPDGKQFFMAYTDWAELRKWKDEDNQQTFAFRFPDYADMLFRKTPDGKECPASGFIINPFGGNMVITKEIAANWMALILKQAQQGKFNPDSQPVPPEKT